VLHEVAVGDQVGRTRINVFPDDQGRSGLNSILDPSESADVESLEIDITTIPQLMSDVQVNCLDLVKVDTEGFDFMVLTGAMPVLRSGAIGAMQFEYNHRWLRAGHSLEDVFDLLQGTDYLLGRLNQRGLEIYSSWHPELDRFFEANFVMVHPMLLPRVPHWVIDFDKFGAPTSAPSLPVVRQAKTVPKG
jgi:hypothetical protein